jgi:2-epi-5-epi-valiolone synthase
LSTASLRLPITGAIYDQSPELALTIAADRTVRYSLVETGHAFEPDGPLSEKIRAAAGTVLVVVDDAIWRVQRNRINRYLAQVAGTYRVLVLPGGERNKTLPQALKIIAAMDECGVLRRSTPVIAIGGGVVCDIVGFAASIYRRGVPYVKVPTTLLAQVDVSVAIKTAVNLGGFRNRIGSFWPAELTIIDRSFLSSQSPAEISQGLGEIFKLALIKSECLFDRLEEIPTDWEPDWYVSGAAADLIRLAIEEMAEDLRSNLWEETLARGVDFGHTFSPLIEMRTAQLGHGHVVALDCLLSACIAVEYGLFEYEFLPRLVAVMRRCHLPTQHPAFADADLLWESLIETRKHRDGHQHLPLPSGIGKHTFVENLDRRGLVRAARLMGGLT